MMPCKRCGKDFDRSDLRPSSRLLQVIAGPFLLFLMLRSRVVRGEVNALYCRPCRRQLNASFLFIAFLVILFLTFYILGQLGIISPAAA